jgi:hypothetical protein
VDERSSNLNQVSTNDLSFLFIHYLLLIYCLEGVRPSKRVGLRVRGLSMPNTCMYVGKVTLSPRTYATVLKTTHVHLFYLSKKYETRG